jgi:GNAT superfamily N-acetyltransferase
MPLEFRACRADRSPARELLHELNELLDAQYPGRSAKPGSVTTPDEMVPPDGIFLVGYDDELAVACGGVRRLGEGLAEIKRMYVVPDARSHGVGRALLEALEDACRELGYRTVRLDAGPAQTHSKSLFARTGYREIAPYNANHIADYFAEKDLVAAGQRGVPGPSSRP